MTLHFGRFSLDPLEYRLRRDGQAVALPPKPFDLLVALAGKPGQLVTREALLAEVWKDVVVEQSSLNAAMSVLRQALGEDAASTIETVPGRGYRFIAPLTGAPAAATAPASSPSARVVIVDDHAVVRMGVRALVERAGLTVVGEGGTLNEGRELVRTHQPDVLVLDLMMGDQTSLEHIRDWRSAAPGVRVVVLSMHDEDHYARRALEAGAQAYVMKGDMLGELTSAIAAILAGGLWISAKLTQSIVQDYLKTIAR